MTEEMLAVLAKAREKAAAVKRAMAQERASQSRP